MLTQSETKYFTPSIEDIRVGYECEQHVNVPPMDFDEAIKDLSDMQSVQKMVWGKSTILTAEGIPFIVKQIKDGNIRVSYLTKEQIEAEGWKPLDKLSPFTGKPYKWQKVIGEKETGVFNEDHIYTLEFEPLSHLTIHLEWESSWNRFEGNIFVGRCPDINTFRYICKLLGI